MSEPENIASAKDSGIRPITAGEVDPAIELLVDVYGEAVRAFAAQEVRRMFSAETYRPVFIGTFANGALVAIAAVIECPFTVETFGLGWMAVRPTLQRKGIGQRLVRAAIAYTSSTLLDGRPGSLLLAAYDNLSDYYGRLNFSGTAPMHEHSQFMSLVLNEPPADPSSPQPAISAVRID